MRRTLRVSVLVVGCQADAITPEGAHAWFTQRDISGLRGVAGLAYAENRGGPRLTAHKMACPIGDNRSSDIR